MAKLIAASDLKQHIVVDYNDDDTYLEDLSEEATSIVLNYLKKPDDYWTVATLPSHVKTALRLVAARVHDDRTGELEGGVLNKNVRDLLHRERDPALA